MPTFVASIERQETCLCQRQRSGTKAKLIPRRKILEFLSPYKNRFRRKINLKSEPNDRNLSLILLSKCKYL